MRNSEYIVKKIKSILNKALLVFFYVAIVVGIGFAGYYLYLTNFNFYFEEQELKIEVGDTKKAKIITVKQFDVKDGDYIYTIKNTNNKKVASVDSKGNVRALSVGVAVLEVKYKQSIFPKSIKIYVIPKEDEEDIKDDSESSSNSSSNTQDNSEELELPF